MSARRTKVAGPAARPAPSPAVLAPRWYLTIAAALVASGAVLRIVAARDDFWFDEIWSLLSAENSQSLLDIFKRAHDNNHHLVTGWMYLVGKQQSWLVYRLPSLFAGVTTVALAGVAGRRFGRAEGLIATYLAAFSLVLVTYGSEARGYALAGLFALAGWIALDRYLARRSILSNIAFCLAIVLGLLAHVTFVFFLAGALAWWLVALWQQRVSASRWAVDFSRCFALPLVALAVFYFVHIRPMLIGGGPVADVLNVVTQTLALTAGGSGAGPLALLAALLVTVGLIAGIVILAREKSPLAAFFAVAIFLAPLAVIVLRRPEQLYPRYFYLPLVFALLLLSVPLGRLARAGTAARVGLATALVVFLIANAVLLSGFLRDGRGNYLAALEYIVAHSPPGPIVIESNYDFESVRMLLFYSRRLPPNTPLAYETQDAPTPGMPQWAIVWDQSQPYVPHDAITDTRGRKFVFKRVFPYSGLSGYHWAVYRSLDWEQHRPISR